MKPVKAITGRLASMRTSSAQEALLAKISAQLEHIQSNHHDKEAPEVLRGDLATLALHGHESNSALIRPWVASVDALARHNPVAAALAAHDTARQEPAEIGIVAAAHKSLTRLLPQWAANDFDGAHNAFYALSEQVPAYFDIYPEMVLAYAYICRTDDLLHSDPAVMKNLCTMTHKLIREGKIGITEAEGEAVRAALQTVLDCADKFAGTDPAAVESALLHTGAMLLQHGGYREFRSRTATALANFARPDSIESFQKRLSFITELDNVPGTSPMAAARYIEKALTRPARLVMENPVGMGVLAAQLVKQFGNTAPAAAGKADAVLTMSIGAIAQIKDLYRLADALRPYPEAHAGALEKIYQRAELRMTGTGTAQSLRSLRIMSFVAGSAPTFSPLQQRALDSMFSALDRLAADDSFAALEEATALLDVTHKIGTARHEKVRGAYKLEESLSHNDYRYSAAYLEAFLANSFDGYGPEGERRKALLQGAAHLENMADAIADLREKTAPEPNGLVPLSRKIFSIVEALIEAKASPQERADAWDRVLTRTGKNHPASAIAGARYLKEAGKTEQQQGPRAALDMLLPYIYKSIEEKRNHSNLFSSAVDNVRRILGENAYRDPETVSGYLRQIRQHPTFRTHYKTFKWAQYMAQDIRKIDGAKRLGSQIGVDGETVYNAGFSRGGLRRLYNKHAFMDWLDKGLSAKPVRITLGLAAGIGSGFHLAGMWLPLAQDNGQKIAATAGIAVASIVIGALAPVFAGATAKHLSAGKDRMAARLLQSAEQGPVPVPRRRMDIDSFIARHGQDGPGPV